MFSAVAKFKERKEAKVLVLPFWTRNGEARAAAKFDDLGALLKESCKTPIDLKDFTGKEGEQLLIYLPKGKKTNEELKETRCLLIGLGREEELSCELLRRCYGQLAKFCQKKGLESINLLLPTISELRTCTLDELLSGIAEGIKRGHY